MKVGERLRVVLDTNVILNALSSKLPYRAVLQNLLAGGFELCVTTEILLEYEEKITEFYSLPTATILLDALTMSSHVRRRKSFFASMSSLMWTITSFWTALLLPMRTTLFPTIRISAS